MCVFIVGGIPELLLKVQVLLRSCSVCAFNAFQKSRGAHNCNEFLVLFNTPVLWSNKEVPQAPCEIHTKTFLTLGFSVARSP